jgi:predicted O-methyltransferase YrrM
VLKSFDNLPNAGEDWFGDLNKKVLSSIVPGLPKGSRILEIGSWLGRSAAFMLQLNPGVTISCCDTWEGDKSHQEQGLTDNLFGRFKTNMETLGLLDRVEILQCDSKDLHERLGPNNNYQLVYIDAYHSDDAAYQDVKTAYKHIENGRFIVGDDWMSVGVGVVKAWREIRKEERERSQYLGGMSVQENVYWMMRYTWYNEWK